VPRCSQFTSGFFFPSDCFPTEIKFHLILKSGPELFPQHLNRNSLSHSPLSYVPYQNIGMMINGLGVSC
jgi:hypothetical protein